MRRKTAHNKSDSFIELHIPVMARHRICEWTVEAGRRENDIIQK